MSRLIGLGAFLLVSALVLPSTLAAQDKDKKDKGDANRITAEDIATKPEVRNAEEAIRMLRPAWFRPCKPNSAGVTRETAVRPALYVDEVRTQMSLGEIRVDQVTEMKYMPGSRALALYGDGHECGAIFVVRRKP